jgi:hypothetical protein
MTIAIPNDLGLWIMIFALGYNVGVLREQYWENKRKQNAERTKEQRPISPS